MPEAPTQVSVTWWQSGVMLTVAAVVIVHSAVVGLWLSPASPIRESVGSTNLAAYVNPYFRQSPETIDPGLQRADEAFLVRAEVRTADGDVVETEWVDVTALQLQSSGLLRTRMERSARQLATNLNIVLTSVPPEVVTAVETDLPEEERPARQDEVENAGAAPIVAQNLFANWAMATQFGTLYTSALTDGTVERVQVRVGLRRVPAYDDRAVTQLPDESFTWVTLGWRDAMAGNAEAQKAFDEYVGGGTNA